MNRSRLRAVGGICTGGSHHGERYLSAPQVDCCLLSAPSRFLVRTQNVHKVQASMPGDGVEMASNCPLSHSLEDEESSDMAPDSPPLGDSAADDDQPESEAVAVYHMPAQKVALLRMNFTAEVSVEDVDFTVELPESLLFGARESDLPIEPFIGKASSRSAIIP